MKVQIVALCGGMGVGKDTVMEGLARDMPINHMSYAKPLKDIGSLMFKAKAGEKMAMHEMYELLVDIFGGPMTAPSFMDVAVIMNNIMKTADETGAVEIYSKGGKPREFLQLVGTDIIRSVEENAWADYMNTVILRDVTEKINKHREDSDQWLMILNSIEKPSADDMLKEPKEPALTYVITDTRFDNEAETISRMKNMIEGKFNLPCEIYRIKLTCSEDEVVRRLMERDGLDENTIRSSFGHASEAGVSNHNVDAVINGERPKEVVLENVKKVMSGNAEIDNDTHEMVTVADIGSVIDLDSLR